MGKEFKGGAKQLPHDMTHCVPIGHAPALLRLAGKSTWAASCPRPHSIAIASTCKGKRQKRLSLLLPSPSRAWPPAPVCAWMQPEGRPQRIPRQQSRPAERTRHGDVLAVALGSSLFGCPGTLDWTDDGCQAGALRKHGYSCLQLFGGPAALDAASARQGRRALPALAPALVIAWNTFVQFRTPQREPLRLTRACAP
eukprot:364604-Chlamydomonas_euryale.AAC.16